MNAKAQLAELVMDHLGRGADLTSIALASAITGLASILGAYADAQERRGNWGGMLARLRAGAAAIEPALPVLRDRGGPGVAAVTEMAERELAFAAVMQGEIARLQAGETTNVD